MNCATRTRWVFLMVLACIGTFARAEESILSFDSEIRIANDGSLGVAETIVVRAEGENIRRGIYRDFPTRYQDRNGLRHSVDFEVISLERDGKIEPFFTESLSNGVRVNFGNDDFLPVPGEFTYVLRYRTRRQIGFFADHDELYWNSTGNDWAFRIERASARIELPQTVAPNELRLDAYTGPTGSRANASSAEKLDNGAIWRLDTPLSPGEGMTVTLGFPKGIVQAPSSSERLGWMLRDLAGPLCSFFALVGLLGFYLWLWRRIGRDPAAGTIIVQYEPAEGHSPAGLRFVRRYGYDAVCFSADAVALGVAGVLRIEREKGFFKDGWSLHRGDTPFKGSTSLASSMQTLAQTLFAGGPSSIKLDESNRVLLMGAKSAHEAALKRIYQPRYFETNYGWLGLGIVVTLVASVVALALTRGNEVAILLVLAGGALMLTTSIVFAFLLRRPTREGRSLLDHIEGLRRYLSVAERDELASLTSPAPQLDAARYQALLPYALALDVESAWTARFTAAVGTAVAAEAARSAHWVGGTGFASSSFTDLGSALGSSFSSQIASSSSPPGSSSGGGGGGSSGGGGGGGGGGGR